MKLTYVLFLVVIASLFLVGCGTSDEIASVDTETTGAEPVTSGDVEEAVENLLVDETDDVELGEMI